MRSFGAKKRLLEYNTAIILIYMSLKKTIENLLGRQDGIIPLTADIIIANPEKFNPVVVQTAKATTNIAFFLESLLLHQGTSMIDGGKFQVEVSADKCVHPMDFSSGGEYPFSYRDSEQSFNGEFTLGMKRSYGGFFWEREHPVFKIDMRDLDLTFHYVEGDWELTIGKGWSDLTAPSGRDLKMEEYTEVCTGIASPLKNFLEKLGEPSWGSSSSALEIS